MTTSKPNEQFALTPVSILPAATVAVLQDIPVEAKREWITSILVSAAVRHIPTDVLRRTLVGERVDRDLIERIVDPMKETKP